MLRLIASAAIAALICASPSLAETDPPRTVGELAGCAKASDQPVCLLRFAAPWSAQPYRYDTRLVYAPELVQAVGETGIFARAPRRDLFQSGDDVIMVDRRALARALEADRRGASPQAALALLKAEQTPPAVSEMNPQIREVYRQMIMSTRAGAEATIVDAYAGPDALNPAHRPSAALYKAALADWDELDSQAGPGMEMHRRRLAKAQLASGNREAALRADARVEGPKGLREGWIALDSGRLDAAANAAVEVRPSGGENGFQDHEKIAALRAEVIETAETAHRPELAAKVASATLQMALDHKDGPDKVDTIDADAAMAVLVRDGGRAEVAAWADRLDTAGRNPDSEQSAKNGLAATRAWLFLGRNDRATALGRLWLPEGAANPWPCGQDKSPDCAKRSLAKMGIRNEASTLMVRTVPIEEILAAGVRPVTGISLDLMDGRGAGRLSLWLGKLTPDDRMAALSHCVWVAGQKAALDAGHVCMNAALPHIPPRAYYAAHPPGDQGSTAVEFGDDMLGLAAEAAKQGKVQQMRADLDLALDLFSRTPEQPFLGLYAEHLRDIAIAELRQQGRL